MAKKKKESAEETIIDAEQEQEQEKDKPAGNQMELGKLLSGLTASLNREFGADTAMLNTEGKVYDNVSDYVKTEIPTVDYILGGKGFPVGRINEIYGAPSSGKTALAMHILKTTIDRGGVAVMLDSEAAFSFDMAQKIGVDLTKLIYLKPKTLQDIWRQAEKIIDFVKLKSPNQLCTIVVDSVANAPSEKEVQGDVADAEMGERARINSKALRKITMDISDNNICMILVNQVRDAIGVMYGDAETIPGGKALDFAASIKLRIHKSKQIVSETDKDGAPIGQIIKLKVTKNKVAPPFMSADLELFFDSGISKWSGLFEKMKKESVIYKNGSYWAFNNPNGEKENFYEKDFEAFMENHLYLCDFSTWKNYKVVVEKEDA